jgi:hypothetical protein
MAWRMVLQPNGLFARFSDVVDDFTHWNYNREQAVALCVEEGLHISDAEAKVQRAQASPQRYSEELETIEMIHGAVRRKEREQQLEQQLEEPVRR